jgi:creatinine amidohydrolase
MSRSTRRRFLDSVPGAIGLGLLGRNAPAQDVYVNRKRVLLWECTRKEIREALAAGRLKAAIVPTGSTEQHNEHLAMICDTACATLVSQEAALSLYPQVMVATPCPIGYSPYHMERPGTLWIRPETFLGYVHDVINSLKTHGIRTVYIVNGHAGNHKFLQDALPEWRQEFKITLDANSYWNGYTAEDFKKYLQSNAGVSHAAEFETSLLLAAFPERVRRFTLEEYDRAKLDFDQETVLTPPGENARDRARQEQALLATAEKGQAMIAIAIRFVARKLQQMIAATEASKPWPPPA